jgi:hypothetical protein
MARYKYIGRVPMEDKELFERTMKELEDIFRYPKVPSWKDATVNDYEVQKVVYTIYNDIDKIREAFAMNQRFYHQGGLSSAKSLLGQEVARMSNDISALTSFLQDLVSRMYRLQGTPKEASMIQIIAYESD